MEMESTNRAFLTGKVIGEPVYSHSLYGEGFYETTLSVKRLSDTCDVLPLTISDRLITAHGIKVGSEISVAGQFRSYNKLVGERSKLILTVFVLEMTEPDLQATNSIELEGYICKPPIYRMTPFKREICDVLLAVNRAYNKSDYIPCIAWGRNARFIRDVAVGSRLSISGRIQSREYVKRLNETESETRVAYEVSINQINTEGVHAGEIFRRTSDPEGPDGTYTVESLEKANAVEKAASSARVGTVDGAESSAGGEDAAFNENDFASGPQSQRQ